MRYVTFKQHKISKLSLGTVQFGLNYGIANSSGKPNQDSVNEIIDYVYEKGINCFDTAQAYGNSEEALGKALLHKHEAVIVSKLKSELFENSLNKNIDRTLDNLHKKKIFGLMLHDSKLLYKWEESYSQLVQNLFNKNKIDCFGVSIYTDEDFELAISNDNVEIIQIPFNIFDQRAVSKQWFQKAKEANKLLFIRSIFLQGLFFMKKNQLQGNLSQAWTYLEKLHKLATKLELSVEQLAMAYVDNIARDSILLFGCDTLFQAQENIVNYEQKLTLTEEVLEEIRQLFVNIPEDVINPTLWRV